MLKCGEHIRIKNNLFKTYIPHKYRVISIVYNDFFSKFEVLFECKRCGKRIRRHFMEHEELIKLGFEISELKDIIATREIKYYKNKIMNKNYEYLI